MRSHNVLYGGGNNDECYTPEYAITPLIQYVPHDVIIWCPFDTDSSAYVRVLNKHFTVIASHITNNHDYYTYEPQRWDIMISNPPFTNKRKIFERALSFNKPFALLMSNTWLNDAAPMQLFAHKQLQLLMFDRRIRYICPDGRPNNKITFSSSYYCWNFLPQQIIMHALSRADTQN